MVLAWANHEAQTGGSGFGFEGLKKNDPGIEADIEARSGLPYTPIEKSDIVCDIAYDIIL